MTKNRKYPSTELADAVAPARERHRALIDAACAWQAGRERRTDPDHFALICAGADVAWDDAVTPTRWTRTAAHHVMRCDIPNWCSSQRCRWPETLPEAMWEWFTFLHETHRLHPRSDPAAELRKPPACYGWLDEHGRKLPPDAERVIECECFVPYRETAALLGELARRGERRGEDPLDALRRAAGPRWDPDEVLFGRDTLDTGDSPDAGGPLDGLLDGPLDGYGSIGLSDELRWADPAPED